ncbi:MAG: hypothetical protein FWE48_05120 [Coriobacteriia bacterium]|nr:hypothetical protein [Coriobacteriia bacterium]MCL2746449.1 hypothetical protein [Coriobacteriia bacterium]MCL2870653.1 hypothetical protein [Coriobacteriia bacterium]
MEESTAFDKLLASDTFSRFSRFWFFCFTIALILPLLGPDRIWILSAAPFALLLLNAYIQLLYAIQIRKPILDKRSLSLPRFFLYAGNSFFVFSLLPLAALTFIPGALEEMSDYLIVPLTSAEVTTGLFLLLGCAILTVLGTLLSIVRGRQMEALAKEGEGGQGKEG